MKRTLLFRLDAKSFWPCWPVTQTSQEKRTRKAETHNYKLTLSHTHTHVLTHTHSLCLLCISLSLSHTLMYSLTHIHTLCLLYISLCLCLCLSTHTHTHSHTHTLFVSSYISLSVSASHTLRQTQNPRLRQRMMSKDIGTPSHSHFQMILIRKINCFPFWVILYALTVFLTFKPKSDIKEAKNCYTLSAAE